jgi:antitoxin (DNA-binding transcriptional repressor) of toxin-antitoxin stability system
MLVTDRGEVVAELVPPGQRMDQRGVPWPGSNGEEGRLTLGALKDAALNPKLPSLLKQYRAASS